MKTSFFNNFIYRVLRVCISI